MARLVRPLSAALALYLVVAGQSADAQPEFTAPPPKPTTEEQFCRLIESAAGAYGLPITFFTRLLWKESRFRSDAVSPKGAQGIAQFMPGTASERGLADPFDPILAIPASAHLLSDLQNRFGNLGLAAAAYNAGADRVERWLAGNSVLPLETLDYVLSITGLSADEWATDSDPKQIDKEPETCLALTALLKVPGNALEPGIRTVTAPWGVQVAGNFSRAKVISIYSGLKSRYPSAIKTDPMIVGGRMRGRGTRPFYRARVPAESRKEAEQICAALQKAGASCIVLKT